MTIRPERWLAALGLWLLAGAAAANAGPCRHDSHEGRGYVLCEVAAGDDVRLWLRDPEGAILGSFARLEALVAVEGLRLDFAMNAGMFHPDRSPVGLLRTPEGAEGPLVTRAGPGNFGMLPNGVFCIREGGFAVIESRAFAAGAGEGCRYATQSGPLLVIAGRLHPRFLADSESRFVRNGVGVSAGGRHAVFAISDRGVSFHEFARLFRDHLGLPEALYFDGNTSRLYAPGLGRFDGGLPLGPLVGLVSDAGGG
ncbi:MAG: phosphodiester glycosidase family protein [Rhodobacteraceae bacterium]|nr:phosphodiester glycosidase family protein [Paracoccaceae bacterium]